MKLSRLVFECVKDSISLPNKNFDEYGFLNGDFDNSKDYANQISGVFDALNLAFSRLFNSDKIPYSTDEIEINGSTFSFDKGEVINIVEIFKDTYRRIAFRTLNNNKTIRLLETNIPNKVLIEYKKYIPHFTEKDLRTINLDSNNELGFEDSNIELRDYGITDYMCSYVKAFVKGQLLEIIAPDLANLHNNRAEQYFQDLAQASTSFYSNKVKNSFGGLL